MSSFSSRATTYRHRILQAYPSPLPSAIHASCMPHSTLAPMPGANSALDRPRGRHNPCAPCSSMDVHYIASSTLRRLKLKLSTPDKQSVDDSQWLRVGLPSESGAYSYDFIVIVWPLGEQPGDTPFSPHHPATGRISWIQPHTWKTRSRCDIRCVNASPISHLKTCTTRTQCS